MRNLTGLVLFLVLFVLYGNWLQADDLNVSGTVLSITGPEAVHVTEKLRGLSIQFAHVEKEHAITVQWVDTKGRLCGQWEEIIRPPQKTLSLELELKNPIGYNHRITVAVDGMVQPVSLSFHIIYPYQPWVDYEAVTWAGYDTGWAPLMRELGLTGQIWRRERTTDPDWKFYPDNIAYEIFAYYHKRRNEHDTLKKAWAKYPENRTLHHRRPSLTDEGTWVQLRDRLIPRVEEVRDYRPLYYNVADEIGVADQSAISDLDWEYSSRTAWREWLQKKYGSLARLNAQWETDHASWGKVRAFFPTTHYMYDQLWRDCLLPKAFDTIEAFNGEFGTAYTSFADIVGGYKKIRTDDEGMSPEGLKAAYKKAEDLNGRLGTQFATLEEAIAYVQKLEQWMAAQNGSDTRGWNLSWWCDFRDYMEDYMAHGLARGCDIGREADPEGRFGITGTHHPGVYNGHNYAKLVKAVDFIIPYNIGQSFELIRGFDPGYLYMHPTWQTKERLKRDLWYHFFHGVHGVVFWDNHEAKNKFIDRQTGKATERGLSAQPVLREITAGLDRLLLQSKRDHTGVAIYHSQSSVRVEWFQRNIGLGRNYIERMSWHEYRSCQRSMLRSSWLKLIEDNNLQHIFVSPEQVAAGRLAEEGIKLLILPEVWALSSAEARNIVAFVRSGGTVMADQYLGLYDAHGKRRAAGVLDDMFGVDQSGVTGDIRTASPAKGLRIPELDEKRVARLEVTAADGTVGRFVFLNMDLAHYTALRSEQADKAGMVAAFVARFFPPGLKAPARIMKVGVKTSLHGAEVGSWTAGPGRRHLAVWRNYQMNKVGIGGEQYQDTSLFEQKEDALILLDKPAYVCNQRTGKMYGLTDSLNAVLDPWEPIILTLQDTPFTKQPPILKGPEKSKRGSLLAIAIIGAGLEDTLQVFNVAAVDPDGQEVWYFQKDLSTRNGKALYTIPLALNEKTGTWTLRAVDAATGAVAEKAVMVE